MFYPKKRGIVPLIIFVVLMVGFNEAYAKYGPQNQIGVASYYGQRFHGRKTANGERFNMHKLTAAHRSYPFGTVLRVTNLRNNKKVTVRINDRGPYVKGRIIDLSKQAARKLGFINSGITRVKIEVVKPKPLVKPVIDKPQAILSETVLYPTVPRETGMLLW